MSVAAPSSLSSWRIGRSFTRRGVMCDEHHRHLRVLRALWNPGLLHVCCGCPAGRDVVSPNTTPRPPKHSLPLRSLSLHRASHSPALLGPRALSTIWPDLSGGWRLPRDLRRCCGSLRSAAGSCLSPSASRSLTSLGEGSLDVGVAGGRRAATNRRSSAADAHAQVWARHGVCAGRLMCADINTWDCVRRRLRSLGMHTCNERERSLQRTRVCGRNERVRASSLSIGLARTETLKSVSSIKRGLRDARQHQREQRGPDVNSETNSRETAGVEAQENSAAFTAAKDSTAHSTDLRHERNNSGERGRVKRRQKWLFLREICVRIGGRAAWALVLICGAVHRLALASEAKLRAYGQSRHNVACALD